MLNRALLTTLCLFAIACQSQEKVTSTQPLEPTVSKAPSLAPIALFNGKDLTGWHADVPDADNLPDITDSFLVNRFGHLVSQGEPQGHLITNASYSNYRLVVEYRWPGSTGNNGILVHSSKPRRLYGMYPQSIECQLNYGDAGDFWCIGENIHVDNEEARRGDPKLWGVEEGQKRRILHLGNFEKAPKEWNEMVIECKGNDISIWENGKLANHGVCSADHGQIAIQAEGAVCEFRKVELTPLN